jgi:hypothetical protein
MKKLLLIIAVFIAATSFNRSPKTAATWYYVISGHVEGPEKDGCTKWVISNIAVKESSCRTESMVSLLFGEYYQKKLGTVCAIRGIYDKSFDKHSDAAAYQQKLIEENREKGRETDLTDDFVIKCQ